MRVGIDLGGMSIKAGLVDDKYNIIKKDSVVTDVNSGEQIINDIITLCERMREATPDKKLESIGIGVPGHVDSKTKKVVYCNNIPVSNVDLRARVEEACGVRTYIDNDANVAALGEVIAGAAKGYDSAVMITLGTGVGSGIVINRKIFVGCNGAAGELGHMVIKADGIQCKAVVFLGQIFDFNGIIVIRHLYLLHTSVPAFPSFLPASGHPAGPFRRL